MMLHFAYPKVLLFLFIIPVFVIIYFSSFYYNKKKSVNFPNFEAMQRIFGVEIFSRNFFSLYLNLIILVFLIFAAAGTSISYSGNTAFVIAIDNSESMKTADILPTRLDVAKSAAGSFLNLLPDDSEVGVIEFSGRVNVLQVPDASKIKSKMVIEEILPNGEYGTDFDEIIYSTNFLLDDVTKKYLIVISDGQINSGDLNRTIEYAKDNGIIIEAIAIGTESGGLTEAGTISKLDEYSLQKLAFATGGQYSRVEDTVSIERAFEEIALEGEEISLNIVEYLILISVVLFLFDWTIHNFRFRTIP